MSHAVTITALAGLPAIQRGDDLAALLIALLESLQLPLVDGDVLAIAHKVFSKAEGRCFALDQLVPTREAEALAAKVNKDPRKVALILRESKQILRAVKRPEQAEGILIAEHRLGFICANAAVDESNADAAGQLIALPLDPDASARQLRARLAQHFGVRLGVVMTDTFGRPWRIGQVNVAVGLADVPASIDWAGGRDAFGHALQVTRPAFADEIAAAAGLVMIKDRKTPAILFRGLDWQTTPDTRAADLLRPHQEDLFR